MLAAIRSAAVLGIDAYDVTVEIDVANGLPIWLIVGLASSAVKESRERVSAALANSGFDLPARRVTVNLSPVSWSTAKKSTLGGQDESTASGIEYTCRNARQPATAGSSLGAAAHSSPQAFWAA